MLESARSPDATPAATSTQLRRLLALSWPVVMARATQSVIGFSDALLVAPLGEESLAGVTTGAFNTFSFVILPMGTCFILQSFAAQLRGRGAPLGAVRRYGWYGLALALLAGLAALCAIPFIPVAVHRLGYAPGVERAMTAYMSIRFLSVAAVVGNEALGNWFGGLGNTRVAMKAGVTAMVVNVLGCVVLIEPRLGLPGFGVAGAGWASVVASWAGFAVTALAFRRAGQGCEGSGKLLWREFARVLRFGVPNGANWFLEFAAFALFVNVVAGHLGTSVLAAFNVVIQINSVSFMPAWGISTAGAILVGEAIGRRALTEVWPLVRLTGTVAIGWMVTVGLLYLVAPSALVHLFASRDSSGIVAVGATMLTLSALWQLFDGIGITLSEALRAAGDTTWTMAARIALAWGVFVPLAWTTILWRGGGVVSLILVLVAYLALLALALGWRFASGRWRDIELVEPAVT